MKKTGFLIICGLALAAHALDLSRAHPFPIYDEIDYVDLGRDFGARGLTGTVGCYASGDCREDGKHPLYAMAVAPLMDGTAGDFTRGKLASLGFDLLLLAAVFLIAHAAFGGFAGLIAAALFALSPLAASIGQNMTPDGLFTLLYVASLWLLLENRDDRRAWALSGFLAGLAYLAKGNGYFLLLSALVLARDRRLLIAVAGFAAGGWFLLLRNARLWGNPLFNTNNRVLWMDDYRSYYLLSAGPEWDTIGPAWYFRRHGLLDAAARFLSGLAACLVKMVKALAVGPTGLWEISGALMLLLVVLGLRRAWKAGRRSLVLAVLLPAAVQIAAFAFGNPSIGANLRYFAPLAVSLLPFAAWELATRAKKMERGATLALLAACLATAAAHRAGLLGDPRAYWASPPGWHETSVWLRDHPDAAGFLADPATFYSAWDASTARRTSFPLDASPELVDSFRRRRGIRYVVRDAGAGGQWERGKLRFTSSDLRFFVYDEEN